MSHELNGIIVIDKSENVTSAEVVARVKKLLKTKKVGHTGTLDPFASGVLICCINRATRLANFFLHGNKRYEAVLHLGIETDTQDVTGSITSVYDLGTAKTETYTKRNIRKVFKKFKGSIEQLPPVYSALKHHGVPLYKLARKGKPIQKPARTVFISALEIKDIKLPYIRFDVSCSAGTYIRTLGADIGKTIGCGGHLKNLRRIESSGFTISEATHFSKLEKLALSENLSDKVICMSDALRGMTEKVADKTLTNKILHGQTIFDHDIILKTVNNQDKLVKVVNANNNLLAVLSRKKESNIYNYCCVFN